MERFTGKGPRFDEYRLPRSKEERQALADQIGEDGFRLSGTVYAPGSLNVIRVAQWMEDPYLATARRVPFLAVVSQAA